MNLKSAFLYALARLSERSTWIGFIGLFTAAGITIAPELAEAFASAGAGVAGLLLMLTKDKPTITVNPVITVKAENVEAVKVAIAASTKAMSENGIG